MEKTDPVELAYDVRGSGSPVLLLAGTGYAAATWPDALIEGLAASHTVITFDYRGTGRSPGSDGPYSTRLFAADAIRLLAELRVGPAHVIGHSMGGRVAQWLALDAPEAVRSIVLAASGPGAYQDDQPAITGIPLETALALAEKGYERYIGDQIRSTFFPPEFTAAAPATVDQLIRAFWDHRPGLRDYLKHVVARQGHRTVDRLAEIRQPVLVIVGDRDTHRGGTGSHIEQSEYLAAHLPDARLAIVEGAAHGYFWQCPDRVVPEILAFFAENDRA